MVLAMMMAMVWGTTRLTADEGVYRDASDLRRPATSQLIYPTATMTLEVDAACTTPDEPADIEMWIRNIRPDSRLINSVQAFLEWDPACWDVVDYASGMGGSEMVTLNNKEGWIDYSVLLMEDLPCGETMIGTLTFEAADGVTYCEPELTFIEYLYDVIPLRIGIMGWPWVIGRPTDELPGTLSMDPDPTGADPFLDFVIDAECTDE